MVYRAMVTAYFTDPVFIYHASVAVSKLRLPTWAEPFAGQESLNLQWLCIIFLNLCIWMNHVQIMNTSFQGSLLFRIAWLYSQPYCSYGHNERPLVLLSRIYSAAEDPFPEYLHQSLCKSWDSVLKDSTTASLCSPFTITSSHSVTCNLLMWNSTTKNPKN